ncbi:MAG: YegS/Rv2252/BmrU family lipid kinase [Acholeplasmataceae bacterium]
MNILVIYNKDSGKGKITKDLPIITNTLDEFKFKYDLCPVTIKDGVNPKTLLTLNTYDTLLIAGGDGTINTILNSVMSLKEEERPKLLFVPYGTTNDTSTMLGLKKKLKENLLLLKTNSYHKMDVYKANDSYFIYASAIGKLTKTSYDIDRKFLKNLGVLGYFINGVRDLFRNYKINVNLINGETKINTKAYLILLIGGNRLAGFSMKRFTNGHKLNDGLIDIRIFKYRSWLSWLKMIPFYVFKGRMFKSDFHYKTSEVDILIDQDLSWNIDGEKGPQGNLKLKVINKAITVYVNPNYVDKLF